jgi:hypothetical protein
MRSRFWNAILGGGLVLAAAGRGEVPAAEPVAGAPPPAASLAFTADGKGFRFDSGALRGTLHPDGRGIGLRPVVEKGSGKQLAGAFGLLSPYRLLAAGERFGTAAWDWPSRARLLANGAVEVSWTADAAHPLEMTAIYRLASPAVLDFEATVRPRRELRRFELFLASYFEGFPSALASIRQAAGAKPSWLVASQTAGAWQMFPRDAAAVELIRDARWKCPPNPVDWVIMPELAFPLAVRQDGGSGVAAVLMAPADDAFAVSMPYQEEGHRSLYLSLFGRDLGPGRTASARARLIIGRAGTVLEADRLYREFVGEQTGPSTSRR